MLRKGSSASRNLAEYHAKRDFTKTREPSASQKASLGHNTYLIQKHAARRLHYDFRLELGGTLKSWAVTRGPSLNPEDKRLAVHVEDHPLSYGSFEGTIPRGQYGGGTVLLWDTGSWEPIGNAKRSYERGNMTFELHGKRLKGRWHLVRMKSRIKTEKRQNWLLIKGKDKYANEEGDYALEHYLKSAVSSRTMEQISEGKKSWNSDSVSSNKNNKPANIIKRRIPGNKNIKSPPDFVEPQLATLVTHPPQGDTWVHEIKFDGYRLLARLNDGKVTLNTRAHHDWTNKFQIIADEIATLDAINAFLDGEVVSVAPDGSMSFHGLQDALSKHTTTTLHFYIFDLLYLNGEDMRQKPLLERKMALEKLLNKPPPHLHYSEHFIESGSNVLGKACQMSLEGIISKRADAAYHSGRDTLWLKSKCGNEQEVVIGGYCMQPKHPSLLAALLTGYFEKGEFIFSGKVGTGFSHRESLSLLTKLKKLNRSSSPFKTLPAPARKNAVWVDPKMVAQVHFSEWTPDGHMRHPSFLGLREDKSAHEVKREEAKPLHAVAGKGKPHTASKSPKKSKGEIAGVAMTHPDKLMYQDENITKIDLAHYYEKVAPLMLPHVAGRPLSVMRCPEGLGKTCFFQRHGSETMPSSVKPIRVRGHGDNQPFFMIEDTQGLVSLVQMGVLEIHVWGCKAMDPEKPDRLVFDLDPSPEVRFSTVKKAALEIRARLKKLKLTSFLKTTGGKGLHIVVPFQTGPSWNEAKGFARSFSQILAEDDPAHFTINSRKNARTGKIFIDYLRTSETASAIAPYSTRARAGAPVALPVDWNTLPLLKSGHDFALKKIDKGLKKNAWVNFHKTKQELPI